jgi:sortase A
VKNQTASSILRWTQRALFACAFLLLGYCGVVLVNGWIFQHRANAKLEHLIHDQATVLATPPEPPRLVSGDLIGRLDIPRLKLSVVVVEGTDKPVLRRAAGHIVGTGLPGQPGNVGIAAHRDTLFRPLRNIQNNDVLTLTTARGEYQYRVVSTQVVSPYDVAVLNPDGTEILTLVTCYPFYFVGPAPQRFIVRAKRVT